MNLLLGGGQSLGHQGLHRVTGQTQDAGKLCFLVGTEALEDIVRHGSGVIGSTNADSDPVEIESSESSGNVFQSIVASVTATELEANGAVGQIEVIVDHHQLGGGNLVKGEHRLHGSTGAVHETGECRQPQGEPCGV